MFNPSFCLNETQEKSKLFRQNSLLEQVNNCSIIAVEKLKKNIDHPNKELKTPSEIKIILHLKLLMSYEKFLGGKQYPKVPIRFRQLIPSPELLVSTSMGVSFLE